MNNYAKKTNRYFTRIEALEEIKVVLEDNYNGCYADLHNEAFNMDYYVIGYAEAKKALEEYGVFEAIGVVREYEEFNFGEYYTDISNPEKLANMLWYIIGEEAMREIESITEHWNDKADDEINSEILKEIEALMEE